MGDQEGKGRGKGSQASCRGSAAHACMWRRTDAQQATFQPCRGAISDFHAYKQKIVDADYDPICLMLNEDDVFGDGNNYQVCA